MPVVTRNQHKRNIANNAPLVDNNNNEKINIEEDTFDFDRSFNSKIREIMNNFEACKRSDASISIQLTIMSNMFKIINEDLFSSTKKNIFRRIQFVCVLFMKVLEFENSYENNLFKNADKESLEPFLRELNIAKRNCIGAINTFDEEGTPYKNIVLMAKKNITTLHARLIKLNKIVLDNYTTNSYCVDVSSIEKYREVVEDSDCCVIIHRVDKGVVITNKYYMTKSK